MGAIERDFTKADKIFLGTDKVLVYEIFQPGTTQEQIDDGTAVPLDVTGFNWRWSLKVSDKAADPGLIEKTTVSGIVTTGAYAATMAENEQRVRVTLLDTDSDGSTTLKAKKYRYSLKRTDDGSEDVYAFGSFVFRQATAR